MNDRENVRTHKKLFFVTCRQIFRLRKDGQQVQPESRDVVEASEESGRAGVAAAVRGGRPASPAANPCLQLGPANPEPDSAEAGHRLFIHATAPVSGSREPRVSTGRAPTQQVPVSLESSVLAQLLVQQRPVRRQKGPSTASSLLL